MTKLGVAQSQFLISVFSVRVNCTGLMLSKYIDRYGFENN